MSIAATDVIYILMTLLIDMNMTNMAEKLILKILPIACVCFMAACSEQGGSGVGRSEGAVAKDKQVPVRVVPAELRDASGMLTVKPGAIDGCESSGGPIAVEVSWDASSARTHGVQIFLQDKGGERKLWSAAGATGKGMTGSWMRDGSVITLVNGENGVQLAQAILKEVPCG
jgi:hypothetical protein